MAAAPPLLRSQSSRSAKPALAMRRRLSTCRPRACGDPVHAEHAASLDIATNALGYWVPACAGTTRDAQPNAFVGCFALSWKPPGLRQQLPLLLRLFDVFHRTRNHRRPGAELAQWLPLDGVALHVSRRDAVAERAGRVVLRDHPGRSPEKVGGLARRVAAVARRKLAAIRQLDLDRLDAGHIERLALQIAHPDAEHDVLAALELAGQHADRAGRAKRRVAAHDVAFDKQLLDVLRLCRGVGDESSDRDCDSKRYPRGLHQDLPEKCYIAAAAAGAAPFSI